MSKKRADFRNLILGYSIPALLVMFSGCSRPPEPAGLKQLAPGAQNAGFLTNYQNLKPSPRFENTLSYVRQDDKANIHKYIAVIVDPVEVYVSTNADPSMMPDRGGSALTAYFQNAIVRAVADA